MNRPTPAHRDGSASAMGATHRISPAAIPATRDNGAASTRPSNADCRAAISSRGNGPASAAGNPGKHGVGRGRENA